MASATNDVLYSLNEDMDVERKEDKGTIQDQKSRDKVIIINQAIRIPLYFVLNRTHTYIRSKVRDRDMNRDVTNTSFARV